MKLLVVTADDFGLSPGVNRGIVEAHSSGLVTATSLLVNLPHGQDAARLARELPALNVGVHLNLTTGAPLTDCSLLVRADGRFRPLHQVALRTAVSERARRQATAELLAQVERAIEWGLQPTHLDGHHHVHVLPQIIACVLRIASRTGAAVRRPSEPVRLTPTGAPLRELTAGLCASVLASQYRRWGVRTSDHFVGYRLRGATLTPAAVLRTLASVGNGVTELMTHPGHMDDEIRRWTSYAAGREHELSTVRDPDLRVDLRQRGWKLAGWRDVQN